MASNSARLGRFFDDLVRCETRLYNALGETLRTRHGIVTSQFEFLRYLRDHPASRVADVATNFAAGVGAISKAVDRLEAQGWVVRSPNPEDRRSSLIGLTARGRRLTADAERTFVARLAELTAGLSTTRLDAAGGVLATLRASLEADGVGLPTG